MRWNNERGLCATCAPRLDQEIAGLQAQAQVNQLNQKIQAQDWTGAYGDYWAFGAPGAGMSSRQPRPMTPRPDMTRGCCGYAEPAWAGRSASPRARLPERRNGIVSAAGDAWG